MSYVFIPRNEKEEENEIEEQNRKFKRLSKLCEENIFAAWRSPYILLIIIDLSRYVIIIIIVKMSKEKDEQTFYDLISWHTSRRIIDERAN